MCLMALREGHFTPFRALGQWFQCPWSLSVVKFTVYSESPQPHYKPISPSSLPSGQKEQMAIIFCRVELSGVKSLQAKLVSYFLSSIISLLNNIPICTLYPQHINSHRNPRYIHDGKHFPMEKFLLLVCDVIILALSNKVRPAPTFVSFTLHQACPTCA